MPTTDPKNAELWLRLGQKLEALLPPPPPAIDFTTQMAFRWVRRSTLLGHVSFLQPVAQFARIDLGDLQHVESQAERVVKNTRQFVRGLPANNVLLTGARGTGKSSLVRACLSAFGDAGLRLIEIDKDDLADLPQIAEMIGQRPERFILFCDDLSFEQGEAGYKALKTVLDGGLSAQADNLLIYATSNRRHLMPESMKDNLSVQYDEHGDLHPGETIEERISLSERFGLWVSFHSFNQADYLDIVAHWLARYGLSPEDRQAARQPALQWATERGSRSGRVALAFAKDWAAQRNSTATE
jgi:predicted AAA+ superfamily ATPase